MNTPQILTSGWLCLALLAACDKAPDTRLADEAQRQISAAQAALRQQADDFENQSRDLQRQLTELEKAILKKESSDLREKVAEIRAENERLQESARVARQRSDDLTADLQTSLHRPPQPVPTPIVNLAPQEPSLPVFRRELASHGAWMDSDTHGSVWRPGLASNLSWRPYVDGSWNWSSQGWIWASNEPFGGICYHYGRWIQLPRHGWVWVPDTQWAPAWVSWRTGPDCIGWAPLPPEPRGGFQTVGPDCDRRLGISSGAYSFISTRQFVRSSYTDCLLRPAQVVQIFSHTTNITQIVSSGQGHQTTHQHQGGPDRDHIESVCHSPVPQREPPRPIAVQTPAIPAKKPLSVVTETGRQSRPSISAVEMPSPPPARSLATNSAEPATIADRRPQPVTVQTESPAEPAPAPPVTAVESPPMAQVVETVQRQETSQPEVIAPTPNLRDRQEADERDRQRDAQQAAMRAEQERQRQMAEEAGSQRQAQELAMRQQAEMAAREAAMRAEQERQRQMAEQAERQRDAQEQAMRQQAEMAAREAAMRAEQERQHQLAEQAERQRDAQEQAMRQQAEMAARQAAMRAEQERQRQPEIRPEPQP